MKKEKIIIPEQKKTKKEIVKMLLANNKLTSEDETDLIDLLFDESITIDIDKQEEAKKTKGDRVADRLSEVAGSWAFIITFSCFLVIWICLNVFYFPNAKVDPYPFTLLNLMLSCIAALQAPIIMMSQNRQSKKDSLRNHNDYRIDLKSELILECLHDEMNNIIKTQKEILKVLNTEKNEDEKK